MAVSYKESAEHLFKLPDKKNKFKNKNSFRVKVLTHPRAFSGPATNSGRVNTLDESTVASKYVFMGRVLDPDMSHHRFLQDPCDISTRSSKENAEHAALLTALHTKIILSTKAVKPSFKVGDYIWATALPGDNNMIYDLQHMQFTAIDDTFPEVYSQMLCRDLATLMKGGMDDYVGSIEELEDEEILECAKEYDKGGSSTWNSTSNNSKISTLHASFQAHIKCFIHKSFNDLGIKIQLKDGYRSIERSNEMRADWIAGRRTGLAAQPAKGGSSMHNYGLAIDLNAILKNGQWLTSNSSKADWINSGIVSLGESLGFRWGGTFSNNYDPVHFDAKSLIGKSTAELLSLAEAQGVPGNEITIA